MVSSTKDNQSHSRKRDNCGKETTLKNGRRSGPPISWVNGPTTSSLRSSQGWGSNGSLISTAPGHSLVTGIPDKMWTGRKWCLPVWHGGWKCEACNMGVSPLKCKPAHRLVGNHRRPYPRKSLSILGSQEPKL